ncbi:hypothetical protein D3C71_1296280 [compost metagenome]
MILVLLEPTRLIFGNKLVIRVIKAIVPQKSQLRLQRLLNGLELLPDQSFAKRLPRKKLAVQHHHGNVPVRHISAELIEQLPVNFRQLHMIDLVAVAADRKALPGVPVQIHIASRSHIFGLKNNLRDAPFLEIVKPALQ